MFGKGKLRDKITELELDIENLIDENTELLEEIDSLRKLYLDASNAFYAIQEAFPFMLGDVVYDLELRNEKGRYAKRNPSYEHCLINEVVVTKNNYFSLITRMENKDVFRERCEAEAELRAKCGISENS